MNEYQEALDNIKLNYDAEYVNECNDEFCQAMKGYISVIENLIKEHFALVEEYKDTRKELDCYYEMLYNPQPYKFEDLQTEMQVYDNYLKECIEISVMCGRNRANHTVTFFRWGQEELEVVKFEENRFYPIHIAKRGVSDV